MDAKTYKQICLHTFYKRSNSPNKTKVKQIQQNDQNKLNKET